MQIFVKTNAIQEHQMRKEVAKPAALKEMKEIYDSEVSKSNSTWFANRVDVSEARKNAKLYGRNLERVGPETLSPAVKDAMWKKAKALKDEFAQGMLSKEELHPVKGFLIDGKMKWVVDEEKMQSLKSVERNSAWYKRNGDKLREFKNIMRHLCPEDPNAGDIEKFRPKLRGIR